MLKNDKYIKINESDEIIDVFYPYQKNKFDGNEIFLEKDPTMEHKINNKSISNEYGDYIFTYIDNKIKEIAIDILPKYKLEKKEKLKQLIKTNWLDIDKTYDEIKTKWNQFKTNSISLTTIEDVDDAYNAAITWLGL